MWFVRWSFGTVLISFSLFSVLNWALMSFNQTAIDSYELKKVVDRPTQTLLCGFTEAARKNLRWFHSIALRIPTRTIFASLARAKERMHLHKKRDFPQAKFDSELNARFYCLIIVYIILFNFKIFKKHCRKDIDESVHKTYTMGRKLWPQLCERLTFTSL